MRRHGLFSFGQLFCCMFAGVVLLLLACATGLVENAVLMNHEEVSQLSLNTPLFYALCAAAGFAVWRFGRSRLFDRLSGSWLFGALALLHLAVGVYLLLHVDDSYIRADSQSCLGVAQGIMGGSYASFGPLGYIDMCPQQLGLVSLFMLLLSIEPSYRFVRCIYLVMELAVLFLLWKGSEQAFGRRSRISKWVLLISFAYLPHLFGMLFLYNGMPSLLCMLACLYAVLRFWKKPGLGWGALAVLMMTLACLIRKNMLIAAIALLLLCALKAVREKRAHCAILALCLIAAPLAATEGMLNHYRRASGAPLDNDVPAIAYVVMGAQEGTRANGWFNRFAYQICYAADDKAERKRLAMEALEERLRTFAQDPAYAVSFYAEKILTTWAEPTCQMLWSGPGISGGVECDSALLKSLYGGGKAWQLFQLTMHVLQFWLYLLAGLYPFLHLRELRRGERPLEWFGLLFFLGGFLFHILWETKSQYALCYVMLLMPAACASLQRLLEHPSRASHLSGGKAETQAGERRLGSEQASEGCDTPPKGFIDKLKRTFSVKSR